MNAPVLLEIKDKIATLTLNRPEKLNALNYETVDLIADFLDELETNPEVRALIITGAGDRAFSAGADIREFSESVRQGPAAAVRDFVRRGQRMTARIEGYGKPIIAAVNGYCFGGGCEILEATHLSVASEKALFAKPEIRLAMPPTFGGTQRLARLSGRKRALEALLTGERFDAQTALSFGLVNRIVPDDELMPAARDLAARIIRHAPLTVAAILTAVTRGLNASIGEGLAVEAEQFASLVRSRDLREGLDAWIARREPAFVGA